MEGDRVEQQRPTRPSNIDTQHDNTAAGNVAAMTSNGTSHGQVQAQAQTQAQTEGDDAATGQSTSAHHFLEAHGSSPKRHELHQSRAGPLTFRHLWKPPVIRQFMKDGKLYKEPAGREPSRLELFFDLAYAGIIHQLAEGTAEAPNGIGLARFILIFYPSWSIWKDVRDYSNVSGTDDVRMRLYILITMLLLYGYSANISSVEVERNEETGHWEFVPESIDAIHAGIAFYLVAKGVRLASFLEYAWALPRFRIPLLLSASALILNAIIYLPATFVDNPTVLYVLPAVAILLEVASRYGLAMLGRMHHDNSRFASTNSNVCIPAINVEHLIERTLQFVVIVFGEVVINASYLAHPGEFGAHAEYGRSALAIIIAFALIWLYFDSDSSRTYIHALRRHWFSNIGYTLIHFPLTGAIILFSASLARIIPEAEVPEGVKWFFSGGIATALACIGLIGTMHRGMDQYRSGVLPRSVRLALRFAIAILLATFPLFHPEDMTVKLGIVAAILSGLVAVETLGKLGAVRLDVDDTKYEGEPTAAPRRQVKASKQWNRHKADLTEGEKGEEDVGVEESLGDMEVRDIHLAQRLAYTA